MPTTELMSTEIALDSLERPQRKLLDEVLTITPKTTFVRTGNSFGSSASSVAPMTTFPPFTFYLPTSERNVIRIPMAIASCITGSFLNDVQCTDKHCTIGPADATFRGTLLEKQVAVVAEAQRLLESSRTCLLALHTGFGKTILGAYLACQLGLRTLVIYPMTTLGPQWKSTFDEFTNLESVVVNERGTWVARTTSRKAKKSNETSSASENKQAAPKRGCKRTRDAAVTENTSCMSGASAASSSTGATAYPSVVLCLNQRVKKLPKDYLDSVGLVILDEAHCLCTPSNVEALLSCSPKYLVGLTATWNRTDNLHYMLELLMGTSDDFIVRKSERPFNVFKVYTRIAPEVRYTPRGLDWSHVVETLSLNPRRNQLVLDIARTADCKTLVLTERVPHAQLLHEMFVSAGFRTDYLAGKKSTYSDSRILIGTVSKIGTGFDERAACSDFGGERISLLILLLSTKSKTRIEQSVGRVFRSEYPRVVHFVDDHKVCERHWRVAKSWYISRNGQIVTCESKDLIDAPGDATTNESSRGASSAEAQVSNVVDDEDGNDGVDVDVDDDSGEDAIDNADEDDGEGEPDV